jgi:hypothetical protein
LTALIIGSSQLCGARSNLDHPIGQYTFAFKSIKTYLKKANPSL